MQNMISCLLGRGVRRVRNQKCVTFPCILFLLKILKQSNFFICDYKTAGRLLRHGYASVLYTRQRV